jgi:drug/metabolite transporter (DMT)-like permease
MRATQGLAAVALAVLVVATGEVGRTGAIGWGVVSGALGCLGLGAFYAALSAGTMGVIAPIAATGVVIPVAVGLAQGEDPSALQLLGIVVTIVGVVLASGPERAAASSRPLVLAAVAAVAFGTILVCVAEGGERSIAMTLLWARVTNAGICTVLLATRLRGAARPTRQDLPAVVTGATTDASANGTFALAAGMGQVSVSAVLASLYPAVTAVLAWRFHGERLQPVQVVGAATILAGVALIAAG